MNDNKQRAFFTVVGPIHMHVHTVHVRWMERQRQRVTARTLTAAKCLPFVLRKVTDMKHKRLSPSAHCTVDALHLSELSTEVRRFCR